MTMQKYFSEIQDPRHEGYIKHKLADVLTIVMCAVMCRMTELCEIMVFAESRAEFLAENFGITKIPSKPTMSRILSLVDGKKVAEVIINLMKKFVGDDGEIVAVDGKAIRSTSKDGKPHSALQIITAYMTETGLILGQEKIHEKTNEIPTFQQMLEILNVKGKIITADAMHCQRETCKKITRKGGEYVLTLKKNQPELYEDVKFYFDNEKLESFATVEKNHGRIEKRICRKMIQTDWLKKRHDWVGLKNVFAVERIISTPKKTTQETSYYISSLEVDEEKFLSVIREHWKIESLHWILDAVFGEDDCDFHSEQAHITINIFRKFAIALHKKYLAKVGSKRSIRQNLLSCLLNDRLLLDVISS